MASSQYYNLWDCVNTDHPYLAWVSDVSGRSFYDERIKNVLNLINAEPMSLSMAEFFEKVFSRTSDYSQTRTKFMASNVQVGQVLNLISQDPDGRESFKHRLRMNNFAMDVLCEDVRKEMDSVRPKMKLLTKNIEAERITGFNFGQCITNVMETMVPTFSKVMAAAAETTRAVAENTKKTSEFVSKRNILL